MKRFSPGRHSQPAPTPSEPVDVRDGLVVAIATRGSVSVETMHAIMSNISLTDFRMGLATVARKGVIDARNDLARMIRANLDAEMLPGRDTFVLWTDDDAWWKAGSVQLAVRALRGDSSIGVVAGAFCRREPYSPPLAFVRLGGGNTDHVQHLNLDDYPPGALVDVVAVGAHWLLHRASLLAELPAEPFTPRADEQRAEDAAFCARIREVGKRVVVASGLPIAHVDAATGLVYVPYAPPLALIGDQLHRVTVDAIRQTPAASGREYGPGIGGQKGAS